MRKRKVVKKIAVICRFHHSRSSFGISRCARWPLSPHSLCCSREMDEPLDVYSGLDGAQELQDAAVRLRSPQEDTFEAYQQNDLLAKKHAGESLRDKLAFLMPKTAQDVPKTALES